ncbi:MAG: DUF402 domain-containing protein [Actinomycetota bacterium]|nr:DUF402 domain-containing protein [Actinomycetota bacterium]
MSFLYREVWFGRVWRVNATRLVRELDDGTLVLWAPRGAPAKFPVRPDGSEIRIPESEWMLADRTAGGDALGLVRPGAGHSIWVHLDEHGAHVYWYVNFERDVRRTALGIDFVDEKLDLVIQPDGRVVWKDEDELAEAAALGLVDADSVRGEAKRVLEDWPFPTGWETWRPPDPVSPLPELPHGWDRVE